MSADPYPLPSYAVSVWVSGDDLMVAFPGTVTEQGHTIKLPASANGLKAAVTIMRDRAAAESLRIGNKGTPTQWDVERHAGAAWGRVSRRLREEREALIAETNERKLREHTAKVRKLEREQREAAEFLKELGL